ncbi:hypothetical protein ACFSMW_19725 [Virgibacillus halophilus]
MSSEIQQWERDAEIIKYLGEFPDIPLTVIGRDKEHCISLGKDAGYPEWELRHFEEKWQELISEQANLSVRSNLVFARKSSHAIYLDRPDLVIESIIQLDQAESDCRG